jgi:formamidopyrimidine-DNA glycosylase
MPELPEVEVVKRSLKNHILNLTIRKVVINTNKLRYSIDRKEFKKLLKKKIVSVERRSKYLLLNLDKNLSILIHLGMTGKLFIINRGLKRKTSFYYNILEKDEKHNHIEFFLSKNIKLIYNDVRKFGFIKIITTNKTLNNKHLKDLGPEPLSKKFNIKYFQDYKCSKKRKLKDMMMDQKFVSGLGNIYANEIIFFSKVNPSLKIKKIKKTDMENLLYFTKKILKKSIELGGSSIKNFENSDGKKGSFQQKFSVYGREGKKCRKFNCKGIIKKINISNRSTFYCQICQK